VLFNSFEFIFLFLPVSLAGYFLLARYSTFEMALGFLVLASLFFYGYWNPAYLLLILFSIVFNFAIGRRLAIGQSSTNRFLFLLGIVVNLSLLGYFKYANFFVDNLNAVLGTHWSIGNIFLPLAISFFTFQQISYLVDAWQGKTSEYNFLHYCLFVCFFPQLIAGPIVHHREILPQFMRPENLSPNWSNFAVGVSIFALGLFKKTVIADSLSVYVSPVYDTTGGEIDFFLAWGSTLAYTFQLYFDFSGYSDMAVGCARMFGVRLPVNFFSPYKSTSIIEFWRRWHITLSRFLRDYLYIALGGNRKGRYRRYVNLFLTMLLGGLWHGAGWPFVVWGALHGTYLMINHGWKKLTDTANFNLVDNRLYTTFCWAVTFVAVVFSWVYFRAPTLEQANHIALAMLGQSGFELPAGILARIGGVASVLAELGIEPANGGGAIFIANYVWILAAAVVAFFMPNVAQIFHRYDPVLYESARSFHDQRSSAFWTWDYSRPWALVVSIAFLAGVLTLMQVSEFLYFQF
tara:strand:- start:12218 stop:13771 length:1554 start_codon:yes stop_codon:yes gene_type:complete